MNVFTFSEGYGSGSGCVGADYEFDHLDRDRNTRMLLILNRWHSDAKHGYLFTMLFGNFSINLDCADDGFGNLIALSRYEKYHWTHPQDD